MGFEWDEAKRLTNFAKHGIDFVDAARIFEDSFIETEVPARQAHQVIGRTAAGRWLVVIWIDDRAGRYPIHAREASNRIIRRISK